MASSIDDVLNTHTDSLMALPGVEGTAEGRSDGNPCMTVLVLELTDELRAQIPGDIEGYPVVITETGEIRAL